MFSVAQKRHIAEVVEKALLGLRHLEMPTERPRFKLHVDGRESWSWADIEPNWTFDEGHKPVVNRWNEMMDTQATLREPSPHPTDARKVLGELRACFLAKLELSDKEPFATEMAGIREGWRDAVDEINSLIPRWPGTCANCCFDVNTCPAEPEKNDFRKCTYKPRCATLRASTPDTDRQEDNGTS